MADLSVLLSKKLCPKALKCRVPQDSVAGPMKFQKSGACVDDVKSEAVKNILALNENETEII